MKLDDYSRIDKFISGMSFDQEIKPGDFCREANNLFASRWKKRSGWVLLDASSSNQGDQAFILCSSEFDRYFALYFFGSRSIHICIEEDKEQRKVWFFDPASSYSEAGYYQNMSYSVFSSISKIDRDLLISFARRSPDSCIHQALKNWNVE